MNTNPINPSDEEMELNNETDWSDYPDDCDEDPDGYSDDRDDDEDPFEQAMDECGQMPGGGCMLLGTEYCDWDCPFSKSMWANLNKKRDSKGRYAK